MADSSGASTPRGKARADPPELRIDMEPPKDEHKHVELKTMKGDAEGSDRSAKGSARGHKPSASVPGVPVLQHLRSFVDTPASHEFLWPTPRGQNNHGHTPVVPHPTASPDLEKQKEADMLKLEAFMFDFAAALLQSGAPVHKTEKVIDDVSRVFEIDSTFIVFPGVVLATFGKLPKTQTSAKRVTVGLNCARLARLDDLAVSIKKKECNLDEAVTLLDTIMKTPPVFGPWIKVLALTVSSGLIAPMFFGGGWRDLITAAVLGTVVGLLGMLSDKYEKLGRLNTILSALIVSFLARIASGYIPGLCRTSINFSAICWLLPGLSVTTAMIEMATRHIISGTTRMFYAFLIAIELGFGIAVGQRIPWFTPFKDDTCKNKLDVRYNALFFPVTVICWNLLMDANPWQWISMSICAAVGYVVSWAMTTKGAVSPDVTAATAAFSVAVVGNLWARLTGHAAIVPILGGILILVPGSLGVRGVLGFLSGNSDNGVTFALQMIIVALSIAVGVFVGQLIEIPKFLCHKKLNKVNIAF